jgi:hypothetical protein
MSVSDPSTTSEIESGAWSTKVASEKDDFFGRANDWLSEWCSPILVKETRQALKSKQFLYTYGLLLLAVAFWVFVGIGWNQWSGYGEPPNGQDLIYGMFVIMAVPLGIVVPFTAYRSLAKEFEEGTIQLVSITTMKPYQIVLGKLGSAMLQMLVYLSVMAPCLMLGYLLRGVSLPQILWGLLLIVWGSLCLTIVGLFLGGLIKGRGLNTFVSVGFVLGLAWVNYLWYLVAEELIRFSPGNEDGFSLFMFFCIAHSGAIALLLGVAAATQISFRADNHATPVRLAMMVHQGLYLGSLVVGLNFSGPVRLIGIGMFMIIAAHYWLLMGFLMVGEQSGISRRTQRSLPKTFLGRSFGSLFLPGPGRGFLFALAMLWGTCLTIGLMGLFQNQFIQFEAYRAIPAGLGFTSSLDAAATVVLMCVTCIYPSLFLAFIYLLMRWRLLRSPSKAFGYGPFIGLVFGVFLSLTITAGSALVHSDFGQRRMEAGTIASFFNWYWMFAEAISPRSIPVHWFDLFFTLAAIVVLFAVYCAGRELLQVPVAVPQRVLDEARPVEPTLPPGESIDEIFADSPSR